MVDRHGSRLPGATGGPRGEITRTHCTTPSTHAAACSPCCGSPTISCRNALLAPPHSTPQHAQSATAQRTSHHRCPARPPAAHPPPATPSHSRAAQHPQHAHPAVAVVQPDHQLLEHPAHFRLGQPPARPRLQVPEEVPPCRVLHHDCQVAGQQEHLAQAHDKGVGQRAVVQELAHDVGAESAHLQERGWRRGEGRQDI